MTTDENMDARIRAAAGRGQIDPRDLDEPPATATPHADTTVSDPAFGASGGWVNLTPGPDPESAFRNSLLDAVDAATRSSRMR